QLFYARLPNVKGTAGSAAFLIDEVMPTSPAFRWTMNHTVEVDDPLELFKIHETIIEGKANCPESRRPLAESGVK
ncbi:MAG: hypothetical protein PHV59_02155, partial [Victivallales bacterium]|nr:hypothetical protein [Victivallales bacterium]